jgi:hypothetical protein
VILETRGLYWFINPPQQHAHACTHTAPAGGACMRTCAQRVCSLVHCVFLGWFSGSLHISCWSEGNSRVPVTHPLASTLYHHSSSW